MRQASEAKTCIDETSKGDRDCIRSDWPLPPFRWDGQQPIPLSSLNLRCKPRGSTRQAQTETLEIERLAKSKCCTRCRFCSRESRKFQQLSTWADSSMLNLKDFLRAAGYRPFFNFPITSCTITEFNYCVWFSVAMCVVLGLLSSRRQPGQLSPLHGGPV